GAPDTNISSILTNFFPKQKTQHPPSEFREGNYGFISGLVWMKAPHRDGDRPRRRRRRRSRHEGRRCREPGLSPRLLIRKA
ncbi:hypothetical protein CH063_02173, partial [Colletotrichum higginsianum]